MCIWHCLYCLKSGLLDRCFNCRAINTASKGKTGLRLEFMLFYLFWYLWNLLHFVSFFQVAPWGNQSGGNKWFHIGERDYLDRIYTLTHSNDMNVFLLCFVFCFLNCTSFLFFFSTWIISLETTPPIISVVEYFFCSDSIGHYA